MKRFIKSHILLSFVFALSAVAAPVHLDTPEAHIIVTRPIDRWCAEGNGSNFWTKTEQKALFGSVPAVSNVWLSATYSGDPVRTSDFDSDSPLMLAVRSGIIQPRYVPKLNADSFKFFIRDDLIGMTPSQANDFIVQKSAAYKKSVIDVGLTPEEQLKKAERMAVVGVVANVALNMNVIKGLDGSSLPVGGMGLGGGNITNDFAGFNSFLVGLASDMNSATPPIDFDFSPYHSVQYRSIQMRAFKGSSFGDIYIAYKNDPTPEVKFSMEIKAILLTMGMGASLDDVYRAAREEIALRRKILAESVSASPNSK